MGVCELGRGVKVAATQELSLRKFEFFYWNCERGLCRSTTVMGFTAIGEARISPWKSELGFSLTVSATPELSVRKGVSCEGIGEGHIAGQCL